jgi:hypothetical protein
MIFSTECGIKGSNIIVNDFTAFMEMKIVVGADSLSLQGSFF